MMTSAERGSPFRWAAWLALLFAALYVGCSSRPPADKVVDPNETGGSSMTGNGGSTNGGSGTGATGATGVGGTPSTGGASTGGSTPGGGASTGGSAGVGATGAMGGMGGMVMPDDPTCTSYPEQNVRADRIQENHPDAQSRLTQMTQAEKIAILSGESTCPSFNCFDALGVSRVNIPNFRMRDGPRGVRGVNSTPEKATTFAVPEARAASFDLALEYKIGKVTAVELRALRADIMLAPTINTLRHPRWARSQETYGEDPVLVGEMGAAYTLGMQDGPNGMPACPKHYSGNDTDNNRGGGNDPGAVDVRVDEQTQRENYTLPFQIVVEKADPACIMAAYNKVNGQLCTENTHLLTDILRTDWNWTGFTVSDWWATGDPTAAGHGVAALNAGLDLEMPTNEAFRELGAAQATNIDRAAKRILDVRASFGQLSSAYISARMMPQDMAISTNGMLDGVPHADIARESAEKGAILLKNDGILPLGKTVGTLGTASVTSIIVMGPDASKPTADTATGAHGLGDRGSSNTAPPRTVSYLQGLTTRATGVTVTSSNNPADAAGKSVVVIPVTMGHEDEGENYSNGGDRENMTLSGPHPEHWQTKPAMFINQVADVNPNVVVLLAVGGAVIDSNGWMGRARAIVQPFYPGQEGGTAVAKLLFGDINFSAKLPFTVGTNENQYPAFNNTGATNQVTYLHGYRKFQADGAMPQCFPREGSPADCWWFGFGLSYTTYEYSNLRVLCSSVSQQGRLNVEVTVTNTGMMAGDEIVQLYVSYPAGKTRPPKELKAFQRVRIEPGQSVPVQLYVSAKDLRHWGANGWEFDSGMHQVLVGPSSDPAKLLTAPFTMN